MNRRHTSQPIGGEQLTSGERARRAALVAAVYGLDVTDPFRIHEFMSGATDRIGPWATIEEFNLVGRRA